MKKIFSKFLCCASLFFLGVLIFGSCKKAADPIPYNSFSFTFDGATTATVSDTAFTTSLGPYVIKANLDNSFFINKLVFSLSNFTTGSYSFGSGSSNTLQYVDHLGNVLNVVSGSINITSNAYNLLAGNFSVAVIDGSNVSHTSSGSFTNMPIAY